MVSCTEVARVDGRLWWSANQSQQAGHRRPQTSHKQATVSHRQASIRQVSGNHQATVGHKQASIRQLSGNSRPQTGNYEATNRQVSGNYQATNRQVSGNYQASIRQQSVNIKSTECPRSALKTCSAPLPANLPGRFHRRPVPPAVGRLSPSSSLPQHNYASPHLSPAGVANARNHAPPPQRLSCDFIYTKEAPP